MRGRITTHILDTARGKPAAGVSIVLARRDGDAWVEAGRGATDADGRCKTLLAEGALTAGAWRLTFDVSAQSTFFPSVDIAFVVADASQHFHVPLLLSPYSYSTYRGS